MVETWHTCITFIPNYIWFATTDASHLITGCIDTPSRIASTCCSNNESEFSRVMVSISGKRTDERHQMAVHEFLTKQYSLQLLSILLCRSWGGVYVLAS